MTQIRSLPRRLSVSDAKAKLSETLKMVQEAPAIIHNRGRDVAVLMSIEDYDRIAAQPRPRAGRALLEAVQELKKEMGGGAIFRPTRARIRPKSPFAARSKS